MLRRDSRCALMRNCFLSADRNNNIANQIHGFTIDYGKFILISVSISFPKIGPACFEHGGLELSLVGESKKIQNFFWQNVDPVVGCFALKFFNFYLSWTFMGSYQRYCKTMMHAGSCFYIYFEFTVASNKWKMSWITSPLGKQNRTQKVFKQ